MIGSKSHSICLVLRNYIKLLFITDTIHYVQKTLLRQKHVTLTKQDLNPSHKVYEERKTP